MKSKETDVKKQPVSMPVVIAGCLALVVAVFLLLQPSETAHPTNNASVNVEKKSNSVTKDLSIETTVKSKLETDNDLISAGRDPFLPSELFWSRTKSKKDSVTNPISEPIKEQTVISPVTQSTQEKPEPVMSWKGIVTTKDNDSVILINYNNKTHTLRIGDLIPGTRYIVSEVNSESVLLISPERQLRLHKKKEGNK